MPRVNLNDKPILITGASAGIGRATAIHCARLGMPVIATARRLDRLESLASEITDLGGTALPIQLDVTDPDACNHAITTTIDHFGSLYAVLANAGFGIHATLEHTSPQQIKDIFDTNVLGTLNIIRPALNAIRANTPTPRQPRGHILITSSSIGVMPVTKHAAYCATKAAQHHLGRALRAELKPDNIAVSTIHPIGTKTEFFDAIQHAPGKPNQQQSASGLGLGLESGSGPESGSGSGSTSGSNTPDRFMQDPATVATAITNCLRSPRSEVWPGGTWPIRLAFAATLAFPPLLDLILDRRTRNKN